ncbi:MAG: site-specific integrase [Kiritimatiellaeota bacterium]|nr:site-specific integrase [Kiritimatiellota bacterium]
MLRQKKDVIKGIRRIERVIKGQGRTYYEAYAGTNAKGQKIRFSRPTKESLLAALNDFYTLHKKNGDTAVAVLTAYQIHDARAALDELSNAGKQGIGLRECVREYLRMLGDDSRMKDKLLKDAYSEYLASFPEATKKLHRTTIRSRVGKWVATEGADRMCGEVTAADVSAYLSMRKDIPVTTYNGILNYIKTFLGWCAAPERRYIRENPVVTMRKQDKPYEEPEYMRADDVEALLRIFERHGDKSLLCYLVLSFLMGMRSAEIRRVSEEPGAFRLEDGTIRLAKPKGWTKGRPPRIIHVPENTLAWLRRYDVQENIKRLVVDPIGKIKLVVKRAGAGIRIPYNAGRHTFITMHYAAYCDPAKTRALCGTSQSMMNEHYMALGDKAEGLRYFGIMPSAE